MGLYENGYVVTKEALNAVIEEYVDTTGIRDLGQAAERMAINTLYQIEVEHIPAVMFDEGAVQGLLG